jgi:allophanate hydrolase
MDLASLELTFSSVRSGLAHGISADLIVGEACRRAQACAAQGVFTSLVPPEKAVARVGQLQAEANAGAVLPLLGIPFSVKDNVHVAGMITTSNCQGCS